jgi:hypothetical protein
MMGGEADRAHGTMLLILLALCGVGGDFRKRAQPSVSSLTVTAVCFAWRVWRVGRGRRFDSRGPKNGRPPFGDRPSLGREPQHGDVARVTGFGRRRTTYRSCMVLGETVELGGPQERRSGRGSTYYTAASPQDAAASLPFPLTGARPIGEPYALELTGISSDRGALQAQFDPYWKPLSQNKLPLSTPYFHGAPIATFPPSWPRFAVLAPGQCTGSSTPRPQLGHFSSSGTQRHSHEGHTMMTSAPGTHGSCLGGSVASSSGIVQFLRVGNPDGSPLQNECPQDQC